MHYGTIKQCDIANGEGVRTSLFVSGCTHHCPGCFQPETWDFSYGDEYTDQVEEEILQSLEPGYVDGITILGGEPMEPENQRVLVGLLEKVKLRFPEKDVWLFTGDTLEDLQDQGSPRHTEVTEKLLSLVDVLVDGPFREDEKDITLRFRGSANQRIIAMAPTLSEGSVKLWQGDATFAQRGEW